MRRYLDSHAQGLKVAKYGLLVLVHMYMYVNSGHFGRARETDLYALDLASSSEGSARHAESVKILPLLSPESAGSSLFVQRIVDPEAHAQPCIEPAARSLSNSLPLAYPASWTGLLQLRVSHHRVLPGLLES